MDKKELMCKILKSLNDNKEPKASDFNVDLELFGDVVEMMQSNGLIKNATVERGGIGKKVVFTHLGHAKITLGGLNHLEQCGD